MGGVGFFPSRDAGSARGRMGKMDRSHDNGQLPAKKRRIVAKKRADVAPAAACAAKPAKRPVPRPLDEAAASAGARDEDEGKTEHSKTCAACEHRGDLLKCDLCTRAYHANCAELKCRRGAI